ncbi:DNA polymerase [Bat mastadenovirus]|nr:DNA polymerase [Bat mastadenovirus]
MALVPRRRTRGLLPEARDSEHQPPGRPAGHAAAAPEPTAPRAQPGGAAATRRALKGTIVNRRHTQRVFGTNSEGEALEVTYALDPAKGLRNLFLVHLCSAPPEDILHPEALRRDRLLATLEALQPPQGDIYTYARGFFQVHSVTYPESSLPFPIRFLVKNTAGKTIIGLIKDINRVTKCEHCGSFFKAAHTCNVRRRDFYFHHIQTRSANWWEPISFFPIGSNPQTERLFITYDVETYTWHGRHGKQLVPFMLVMHFSGTDELVALAEELAQRHQWQVWSGAAHTYYYLNPQKSSIGSKFKDFRHALQKRTARLLLDFVCKQNPQLREYCQLNAIRSPEDLSPAQMEALRLQGQPRFIEVYVVGHNINGFDEIVLAAQVISNRTDIPSCFRISRNFMPRNGKILFNDITFSLPNPEYHKRVPGQFELWEQGACEASDFKFQYVKFLVRDTFALTHTSLRNAAQAYSLQVEKGCCPYQAVNQFYMFGSYLKDGDGFPAPHYWRDEQEYAFNKEIWQKKGKSEYDIVRQTLEYCALDVVVTAQLVQKLQDSYRTFVAEAVGLPQAHFNIFQRPTISSNSHAIFRQVVYRAERPNRANLGSVLLAPSMELYDYVRASIRGGRCYPSYLGVLQEPIYVYDICGMYASALTHPFPAGRPLHPLDRALAMRAWEQRLLNPAPISYFNTDLLPGIFTLDADPPPEDHLDVLPPFCSRKGGRLAWTNERLRGEIATSIDVITLHNRGWRVRLVPDERTTVFPEWRCVAQEYVQLNIRAKEQADRDKNQTIRSIAKLLSNALYGSFATKLDNKTTVFADQMEDKYLRGIATGEYTVKSSSYIEVDNFSAEILPEFKIFYSPESNQPREHADESQQLSDCEEPPRAPPLYTPPEGHVTYTYKPITFLDVEEGDYCLHTLEKNTPLITNDRYPSQIASFVLAWTRAFVSEWASFLYEEDRGIPLHQRTLKSVYGDTDSLFVTERGRQLMETRGKHRIKKNGGRLVFDPQHPDLTWLVECETQCAFCGADAYASESVFLAPKLYALKDTHCTVCKKVGKGKLRAKGHATTTLSYDLLKSCYYADAQQGSDRFSTSRMSLKRTLASAQSHVQPFTVTETTLKRTLRPWKDQTMNLLEDHHRLVPYSNSAPNPRNREVCWIQLPWDM